MQESSINEENAAAQNMNFNTQIKNTMKEEIVSIKELVEHILTNEQIRNLMIALENKFLDKRIKNKERILRDLQWVYSLVMERMGNSESQIIIKSSMRERFYIWAPKSSE